MCIFHGIAALAIVSLAAPTWAKDEPAESAVICKDGSTSKGGKGACSSHGGVDKKATEASKKAAGATAKCKDGTYWQAKEHSGACSNHGGVADWLDKSAPK